MADDGPGESDVEALRVLREESRAVLDHQIAAQNDLDDKAMRTVRTDVVLLGILATAAGVGGPERVDQLQCIVKMVSLTAGAYLLLSAILGTGVYVVSDLTFGVGSSFRSELRRGTYSEREW